METLRRGSDGGRIFNADFKREQMARIARKELTLAELSRELAVEPSVVRRWKHLSERGSQAAVAAVAIHNDLRERDGATPEP